MSASKRSMNVIFSFLKLFWETEKVTVQKFYSLSPNTYKTFQGCPILSTTSCFSFFLVGMKPCPQTCPQTGHFWTGSTRMTHTDPFWVRLYTPDLCLPLFTIDYSKLGTGAPLLCPPLITLQLILPPPVQPSNKNCKSPLSFVITL